MAVKNLDDVIRLRVTAQEKQTVQTQASQLGLSVSQYLRTLLKLTQSPGFVTDVAWSTYARLGEIYGELSRINSQLNQLVHQAASGETSTCFEMEKLSQAIQQLKQEVSSVRSQLNP